MKLPVMAGRIASPETLWRRYVDVAFDHALALGEATDVAGGRAVVRHAALDSKPELVWAELDATGRADMADFVTRIAVSGSVISTGGHASDGVLRAAGWHSIAGQLVRLTNARPATDKASAGVILPARAAMAAVTRWCEARTDLDLLSHLDDPHYDAFVLLRDGMPLAVAGMQSRGQVGLVCDAFVEPAECRSGLGVAVLNRLVDLAARSQLLDVFATSTNENTAAEAWLNHAGFVPVMPFITYTAR
ncbi:MAG: GNAT family N-acetyltransferase [Tepidisphaeraceae bacterium]